jgi:hypothetical protein
MGGGIYDPEKYGSSNHALASKITTVNTAWATFCPSRRSTLFSWLTSTTNYPLAGERRLDEVC